MSPVRNIPDVAVRHYILQVLGFMWAICFSIALGSYTVFMVSNTKDTSEEYLTADKINLEGFEMDLEQQYANFLVVDCDEVQDVLGKI